MNSYGKRNLDLFYKVDIKPMTNFQTAREAMVDCQVRPSDVTKYPIIDALLRTPREKYVPKEKKICGLHGRTYYYFSK